MKIRELDFFLKRKGVDKNAYSLQGGLPSEKLCLGNVNDKWEVYYSEHGEKSDLELFDSEEVACERFVKRLSKMLKIQIVNIQDNIK